MAVNKLQEIRLELDKATEALHKLKMGAREPLRDFEYRVKRHSDKILSLKIAEQVQQQLLDQEASEVQEQVKKN
ncbi:MAG: hypothetical protein LBD23_10520 [Oscillospiraceae bacterium]|nr:hypothetical protein [Oscillospiraceae bacterium]